MKRPVGYEFWAGGAGESGQFYYVTCAPIVAA